MEPLFPPLPPPANPTEALKRFGEVIQTLLIIRTLDEIIPQPTTSLRVMIILSGYKGFCREHIAARGYQSVL